ncbi:MAG: hypothetical protein ACKVTZ_07045 [Bacteroidia bacterium]
MRAFLLLLIFSATFSVFSQTLQSELNKSATLVFSCAVKVNDSIAIPDIAQNAPAYFLITLSAQGKNILQVHANPEPYLSYYEANDSLWQTLRTCLEKELLLCQVAPPQWKPQKGVSKKILKQLNQKESTQPNMGLQVFVCLLCLTPSFQNTEWTGKFISWEILTPW